jgi:hypothetical protein
MRTSDRAASIKIKPRISGGSSLKGKDNDDDGKFEHTVPFVDDIEEAVTEEGGSC